MSSRKTYQDAVEHLNSLQSNAATLEAVRASGGRLSEFAIPEMLEYLERIGYFPDDLNKLNIIHITGTKGKGSTSAFVNSILQHTKPSWKVGLYSSPHLVAVRERIRIMRRLAHTSLMPGYFRFMTLLAFHAFRELNVDVTVLEVGVGGTYDSTNVVPKPVVTGITALGIDHVNVLGKTLKEIAWHKSGIFKEGVPAFSVPQPSEAMKVLQERAQELQASSLTVVQTPDVLPQITLGLAGKHQIQNASLAVELSREFLKKQNAFDDKGELSQTFIEGLCATKWPGRCQTVPDPVERGLTWYLDGAHTSESLDCCMDWFLSPDVSLDAEEIPPSMKRILIFNCTSGRSGPTLLSKINGKVAAQARKYDPSSYFERVIFCTNVTYADGHFKGDLTTKAISDNEIGNLTTQHQLATAWSSDLPAYPQQNIHILPSIEDAVNQIKKINDNSTSIKVLVTGSLHLVGGVIEVAGLSRVAL
ncbi:hypothetical protein AGABI2DRAFT_150186 [Agaricus bisporus var. bisporus H97]|uniref:hypothetical protein n=1 Tax=Agaricus bisporus var. bisporus (strain H97 / ATCC MYA-4626 / FGSC 10389) TaxID=936046 RepID=UPI00029F6888|nr:hypothetical protein AGABI2DRAFT_150186 [Agaricus bisporus var. bisporus H97]EKV48359.1 hypothetical protein AGABI2DRAFT_150186 [Agaricus bisporus var. bisporus H97]